MKSIFLSYAHEDRPAAERVNAALAVRGYDVFFDRARLRAGVEYDGTIENAIRGSDLFVFLISPHSLSAGGYSLTELGLAKRHWPNPSGRVLPVMARPTVGSRIDAYLQAVTILYPQGNLAAEVASRVREILEEGRAEPIDAPAGSDLLRERIASYRALWGLTGLLPKWPRAIDVSYDQLGALSKALREWYFREGSGLFLSRTAYTAYAAVQDSIAAIVLEGHTGTVADEHYDAVREACSTLRRAMARDVGARVM